MQGWFASLSWKSLFVKLVEGIVVTVLLRIALMAVNVAPNDWLLVFSVVPLTMAFLLLLEQHNPAKPKIHGHISGVRYQGTADTENEPGSGVVLFAQLTNRGAPTSLTDWSVVAIYGNHRYQMATRIPTGDYMMRFDDGQSTLISLRNSLLHIGLNPVARGDVRVGWVEAETTELTSRQLQESTTKFVISCTDAFGMEWELKPESHLRTLFGPGVPPVPGILFQQGRWKAAETPRSGSVDSS